MNEDWREGAAAAVLLRRAHDGAGDELRRVVNRRALHHGRDNIGVGLGVAGAEDAVDFFAGEF